MPAYTLCMNVLYKDSKHFPGFYLPFAVLSQFIYKVVQI
jgi:hypothetical protein